MKPDAGPRADARFSAKRYVDEGYAIVPIPRGEKGPRTPNWQTTTFAVSDVQADDNIGVQLGERSGGLTDVDLDSPEAVLLAPQILPLTDRISGRTSKPRSHYFYRVSESQPEQFRDVNGTVIAEIRTTGQQTRVPPSQHPSGEVLRWEADGKPNSIEFKSLRHAVRLLAASALLGKHWPHRGSRHRGAGCAAGLLAMLKLAVMEIVIVIESAARLANDEEAADRGRYARDTCEKHSRNEPVEGGPVLAELIGESIVRQLRSYFDDHTSQIEQLNEIHAVLYSQSGGVTVLTEELRDGQRHIRLTRPSDLRILYPERVRVGTNAKGSPILKPLGDAWLNSPARRFYRGIELAPNGGTPGYYNLWTGFAVEPRLGNWSLFRRHVEEVICNSDAVNSRYVLNWMAETVQHPERPIETALVLRGRQGTGKGVFVRGFGAVFGVHFVHLDSTRQLTGNFNAHLERGILVFADEAVWAGGKAGVGALNRLITEPTLLIERKGIDAYKVSNLVHLIVASNEDWCVPAAQDARRFVVLDVSRARQEDYPYFRQLEDELYRRDGLSAMLYDLLNWKIDVNLRAIPKTKALAEQKSLSAEPAWQWWEQVLRNGQLCWSEQPEGSEYPVATEVVYGDYVRALQMAGHNRRSLETQLGRFLRTKACPPPYPRRRKVNGVMTYYFPSSSVCREHFVREFQLTAQDVEWPEGSDDPQGTSDEVM